MNLNGFLKRVDENTARMSEETMRVLVHQLARKFPEKERPVFLNMLYEANGGDASCLSADATGTKELAEKVKETVEMLHELEEGERCIDSDFNDEYDDWYAPDVDEFVYEDPEGILPDIEESVALMHRCVDEEAYELGYELAELLSGLEITVDEVSSKCGDGFMKVAELCDKKLLNIRCSEIVRESFFLAYMGNPLQDRAERMYAVVKNYRSSEIRLEHIMQMVTGDLPEFKDFIPRWIEHLGARNDTMAVGLMEEAVGMLGDVVQMRNIAIRFAARFPELYLRLMQRKKEEDGWKLQVGMEALMTIPELYVIRSTIALLTAEAALKSGQHRFAEDCWMQAFRSDPSVVNYLRIRLMMNDLHRCEWEILQICDNLYRRDGGKVKESYYGTSSRVKKGSWIRFRTTALCFLRGNLTRSCRREWMRRKRLDGRLPL